jgi:death-on-curing protein
MVYLDLDEVLAVHAEMVRLFGGSPAVLDIGKIQSAVAQPLMTFGGQDLYPTLVEKATVLGYSLMTNHGFEDGNKRVAYGALVVFLKLNGHDIQATQEEKEAICMAVADHKVEREGLLEWLRQHIVLRSS